jgi:hypothetical protein
MYAEWFADTLNTTTPLLNKRLLEWLSLSFAYAKLTDEEKAGVRVPPSLATHSRAPDIC